MYLQHKAAEVVFLPVIRLFSSSGAIRTDFLPMIVIVIGVLIEEKEEQDV